MSANSNLDIERLQARVNDIDERVVKIKHYAAFDDATFWADERNINTIKLLLLEAIEAASSICIHLCAKVLKEAPAGYADCFSRLCAGGLVPAALGDRLSKMAAFRNKLIHHYQKIDDQKVLEYARQNLGDFEDFIKAIGVHLKQGN